MGPDITVIYKILTSWNKPRTYLDLANEYESIMGAVYKPITWQRSLKKLNLMLAEGGLPALSALIFSEKEQEPGEFFWGTASNIPLVGNTMAWKIILETVETYSWPSDLPISSSTE